MRFSRLYSRQFLAGLAVLGVFLVAAQIQTQNSALAQFSGLPDQSDNPISKLPAPPLSGSQKGASKGGGAVAKSAAAGNPAARFTAAPMPISTPVPTPIPTLKPRFVGQKTIRVGLSTAGGSVAIYAPGGATLFDLDQPGLTLSLPRGARFQFGFGAARTSKRGAKSFRGPISISTSGALSDGWQRVYIAVDGESARVSTNNNSPRYGRPYRGDLEVFPQKLAEPVKRKGALALVNVVPLEAYLRGVVPWEMAPDAPLEALKAQAICARTKTLDFVQSRRFAAGNFDICDYDACQGYPGTENEKPSTSAAVDATKGLAVYRNGRPIDAVYSTNSGGITAGARDVWPGGSPIPYLQSVADFPPNSPLAALWQGGMTEGEWAQFCARDWPSYARPDGLALTKYEARKYRWNQPVSVEEATRSFLSDGISRVTDIQILDRAPSGRIRRLKVTGVDAARLKTMPAVPTAVPPPTPKPVMSKPVAGVSTLSATPVVSSTEPMVRIEPLKSVELQGDGKIRAMFSKRLGSTTALPSSLFTLSPIADARGQITGWNLQGAGWGHGVGMCQRGAQNHAREGWDARKILNFYYRGVEIR